MKENRILIKSGRLLTEKGEQAADLLIEGEKISAIGSSVSVKGKVKEIDAGGRLVFPGIIDPHVHFELEAYNSFSSDDFLSGSRAAAAGGVTTFIDFAIPSEGQDMASRIREKCASAAKKSIVDFSFHSQITSWGPETPGDMKAAVKEGTASFKIFMPATEGWGLDDYGIYRALQTSAGLQSIIMVHAENGAVSDALAGELVKQGKTDISNFPDARPDIVEREAVSRACVLSDEAGAAVYICHLSGGKSASDLRKLRKEGRDILVETTPPYLILNSEKYKGPDACLYACSPPLRSEQDNYQLWRAVIENSVDTIGTDHCPFKREQKLSGGGSFGNTPMGLGGIENTLELMYTEGVVKRGLSPLHIMRLTSFNSAKIFGLYPEKGTLKEGSDADIVIFNPGKVRTIRARKMFSNCDWSPYEGFSAAGCVETTISRGEVVYSKSGIRAEKGRGIFLKRKAFELP